MARGEEEGQGYTEDVQGVGLGPVHLMIVCNSSLDMLSASA
jgi:hypothetical protein